MSAEWALAIIFRRFGKACRWIQSNHRRSDSTHNLKVGASASSQLRFSQRVNRLTVAPPAGISLSETGISSSDGYPSPQNVYSSVYIPVVVRPTFGACPLPIVENQVFVMKTTITTRFRCGCPLTDLTQLTLMFDTLILQYLNKLVESKVRDFASPQAFHTVKVQGFNGNRIIGFTKIGSKFPMKVFALVGNFSM